MKSKMHNSKRVEMAGVVLVFCALGAVSLSASDDAVRGVFPGKDWQQASPESQGLDSARLDAAADYLRKNSGSDGVNQLVIVRNGYLVWKGSEIDKVARRLVGDQILHQHGSRPAHR